jgi:hypothetical protein
MIDDRFRHLKAVVRNAVTWGAAWAVAGGGVVAVLTLFNPALGIESLVERLGVAIVAGLAWGIRFGIAGGVIGTVFSSVVRLGYRGRRLADINPLRFAALGAVVGGVGVPLFLQLMNLLSGDGPVAWGLVLDDAQWATVFGAAAAGGTILLARRADALAHVTRPDLLKPIDDAAVQPPPSERETSTPNRSRSPHS